MHCWDFPEVSILIIGMLSTSRNFLGLQCANSLATLKTHDNLKMFSTRSVWEGNVSRTMLYKIIVEFHSWVFSAEQDYYCIDLFVQVKVFLSGLYNKSLYDWSLETLFSWPEQKVNSLTAVWEVLHVNLAVAALVVFCTNCTCSVCKIARCWCIAGANHAENKRSCKSQV